MHHCYWRFLVNRTKLNCHAKRETNNARAIALLKPKYSTCPPSHCSSSTCGNSREMARLELDAPSYRIHLRRIPTNLVRSTRFVVVLIFRCWNGVTVVVQCLWLWGRSSRLLSQSLYARETILLRIDVLVAAHLCTHRGQHCERFLVRMGVLNHLYGFLRP